MILISASSSEESVGSRMSPNNSPVVAGTAAGGAGADDVLDSASATRPLVVASSSYRRVRSSVSTRSNNNSKKKGGSASFLRKILALSALTVAVGLGWIVVAYTREEDRTTLATNTKTTTTAMTTTNVQQQQQQHGIYGQNDTAAIADGHDKNGTAATPASAPAPPDAAAPQEDVGEDSSPSSSSSSSPSSSWTPATSEYSKMPPLLLDAAYDGGGVGGADPYSVPNLRRRFDAAKNRYVDKLRADYGPELFEKMFFTSNGTGTSAGKPTLGRVALMSASADPPFDIGSGNSNGVSWNRMKRKLLMKVLQVQLSLLEAENQQQLENDKARDGKNDASPSRGQLRRSLLDDFDTADEKTESRTAAAASPARMVPFVWATGGHSAAAGHGNYYDESYTSILEKALRGVFGAVGLRFVGRNYAMGGTASGPEIAFCSESIFGLDADVLSWDYGMTDGRNYAAMELYFRRGCGIHPNRPAAVGLQVGRDGQRLAVLREMERIGLTSLYMPESAYQSVVDLIPDSMGKTPEELEGLAPFVRYFKCERGVEKGDVCGENKYSLDHCPTRKYKTSWHPGWKWHALIGNMIALSMIELLDDALHELAASTSTSTFAAAGLKTLLEELKADEERDYEIFYNSPISDSRAPKMLPVVNGTIADDFDLDVVFRERGICHTARLPAETRHLGILTESSDIGLTTFDSGTPRNVADSTSNDGSSLRLVYDENARQQCDVQLNMDFRDYFYLRQDEGPKSLVVPNDAEKLVYGTGEPLKGLIAFSLVGCSWGRCPSGDVREDGISSGQLEIAVNGVKVTETLDVQSNVFLRHDGGFYFEPNKEGRFEIQVRVLQAETSVRFSSIVVW